MTQSRYPAELFMPPMPIAPAQRQTGQREGFIMSKEVDLPESSRTNAYNERSWNRVNDHYDSNKDYKKMYGSLVQDPEWISSPFVAAKIYQGGEQPAYFPDAQ